MVRNDDLIKQIAGNLALEGMILTDDEKDNLFQCAEGKLSAEDEIRKLINRYRE